MICGLTPRIPYDWTQTIFVEEVTLPFLTEVLNHVITFKLTMNKERQIRLLLFNPFISDFSKGKHRILLVIIHSTESQTFSYQISLFEGMNRIVVVGSNAVWKHPFTLHVLQTLANECNSSSASKPAIRARSPAFSPTRLVAKSSEQGLLHLDHCG